MSLHPRAYQMRCRIAAGLCGAGRYWTEMRHRKGVCKPADKHPRYVVVAGGALMMWGAGPAGAQTATSAAPVLLDRDMTAGAGATVTNAVARLVAGAEDRLVPLRLFEERGR